MAESIKEFGFKVPIIIDSNNVIVAGHTRLKAANKLKIREVPVIIADDLSDEQVKAYRIADNKVSEFSDWDMDLLEKELEDIEDLFTGFDGLEKELNEAIMLEDEILDDDNNKKTCFCPKCGFEFEV